MRVFFFQNIDLFASGPAVSSSASSTVDLFASSESVVQPEPKPTNNNIVDPFASVPLNSFDGSDPFGSFTSHSNPVPSEPSQSFANNGSDHLSGLSSDSKPSAKKDGFQVKSGIWADSLTRGLIDLNISARK